MAQGMAQAMARSFADPVGQSQGMFRAAMNALATPGRLISTNPDLDADTPLPRVAAALGLALLDFETSFHLAPSLLIGAQVVDFLRFHTGARQAFAASEAAFAFVDLEKDALHLAQYALGVPDYPDRSTTIIAIVPSIAAQSAFRIAGPGIKGEGELRVPALPADFAAQWAQNRAQFPLGIDLIFASSEGLIGLPRSTRLLGEAR